MSNVSTIEEDDVPYNQITTNKQPYTSYFESFSKTSSIIENSIANITKNTWIQNILSNSGEQRNYMAWEYWNTIPKNIKENNLQYIIWATSKESSYETYKLDSDLNILERYPNSDGSTKGISHDISHKDLFEIDGVHCFIIKFKNKKNTNKVEIQPYGSVDASDLEKLSHITYGGDGFYM